MSEDYVKIVDLNEQHEKYISQGGCYKVLEWHGDVPSIETDTDTFIDLHDPSEYITVSEHHYRLDQVRQIRSDRKLDE